MSPAPLLPPVPGTVGAPVVPSVFPPGTTLSADRSPSRSASVQLPVRRAEAPSVPLASSDLSWLGRSAKTPPAVPGHSESGICPFQRFQQFRNPYPLDQATNGNASQVHPREG